MCSTTEGRGERRAAVAAWRRDSSGMLHLLRPDRRVATASFTPLASLLVPEAEASPPPLRSVLPPSNPLCSAPCVLTLAPCTGCPVASRRWLAGRRGSPRHSCSSFGRSNTSELGDRCYLLHFVPSQAMESG
jgi:hypothetical protein